MLLVPVLHYVLPAAVAQYRDPVALRVVVGAIAAAVAAIAAFVPGAMRNFNRLQACTVIATVALTGIVLVDTNYNSTSVVFEILIALALGYAFTDYWTPAVCAAVGWAVPVAYGTLRGVPLDGRVLGFTAAFGAAWLVANVASYLRVRWLSVVVLRRTREALLLEGRARDDRALSSLLRAALESAPVAVEPFIQLACEVVAERLGAGRVAFYAWGGQELRALAFAGWPRGAQPPPAPAALYEAVTEAVSNARDAASGEPALIRRDPSDAALAEIAVCVPVRGVAETLGVIAVFAQERFEFDAERAQFLCSVERVVADVIESDRVSRALVTANQRLAEAQELAHAGDWVMDLAAGTSQWSPELYRILGIDPTCLPEELGARYEALIHPADRDFVRRQVETAQRHREAYAIDYRIVRSDGTVRWVHVISRPQEGAPQRRTGVVIDITERKESEQTLERLASYDELTSLPNRSKLGEIVEEAIAGSGTGATVLLVDVDRFRAINDSLGHATGDEILAMLATRLMMLEYRELKVSVARSGGDEFVLVVAGSEAESAAWLATQLVTLLAIPFQFGARELAITVSVGVAFATDASADPAEVFRNADTAMYAAKDAGGNRFEMFSDSMHVAIARRLHVETELRAALAGDELRLHFQPIVDATTQTVAGAEALLRWSGSAPTPMLIRVAEETGLMPQLGEWVLDSAYDRIATWAGRGLRMYVNVSVYQLLDPHFIERMEQRLAKAPHLRNFVVFELTESALVGEEIMNRRVVERLRQFGAGVAIDDFGTGYSSLAYLRRLPVTHLKLDRAFTIDIAGSQADRAIARAVVDVAHTLGLVVTAEGVETQEQWHEVVALGCDQIQGNLFSPALAAEAFEERFLARGAALHLVREI